MMRHLGLTTTLLLGLLCLLPPAALAQHRIMIDAGHGGTNQGAPGPLIQRYEKQLTLALAKRTARYLKLGLPGVEVLMTRQRDRYLTLAQRVRMANRARADLFISLHFNASESHSQRGFETFFLSREASAAETQAAGLGSDRGVNAPGAKATVSKILADLRRVAAHGESALLARSIQRALERVRGRGLNRGVRQAPFDVLIGLAMPGVLVEAGFIDHPRESKELTNPGLQEALAAAVAAGIIEHRLSRRSQVKRPTLAKAARAPAH